MKVYLLPFHSVSQFLLFNVLSNTDEFCVIRGNA